MLVQLYSVLVLECGHGVGEMALWVRALILQACRLEFKSPALHKKKKTRMDACAFNHYCIKKQIHGAPELAGQAAQIKVWASGSRQRAIKEDTQPSALTFTGTTNEPTFTCLQHTHARTHTHCTHIPNKHTLACPQRHTVGIKTLSENILLSPKNLLDVGLLVGWLVGWPLRQNVTMWPWLS